MSTPLQCLPDRTRLTDDDKVLILQLASAGKTQVEIAQVVGCDQTTVSRCLTKFSPTTKLAESRAHNLSLKMIESLNRASKAAEKKGLSAPQTAILEVAGLGGKKEDPGPRVIVQIGVKDSDVSFGG